MTTDAPGSAAPPAGGSTPPGGSPPAGGSAPPPAAPATRPDWLPEAHWDATSAGIKPEFGTHYGELAKFKQTHDETQAALKARKPEDIKFEVKLPDTVKVPDGMQLKIDEKDPRVAPLREMALKHGWSQEQVNDLVAFDAAQQIAAHNAEVARVTAEDQKLGEKGGERKAAVSNWAKGLLDRKEISDGEYEELKLTATSAAGVTLLEKIMAKANGTVPGTGGTPPAPPKPADVPMESRWYSQQKVS